MLQQTPSTCRWAYQAVAPRGTVTSLLRCRNTNHLRHGTNMTASAGVHSRHGAARCNRTTRSMGTLRCHRRQSRPRVLRGVFADNVCCAALRRPIVRRVTCRHCRLGNRTSDRCSARSSPASPPPRCHCQGMTASFLLRRRNVFLIRGCSYRHAAGVHKVIHARLCKCLGQQYGSEGCWYCLSCYSRLKQGSNRTR